MNIAEMSCVSLDNQPDLVVAVGSSFEQTLPFHRPWELVKFLETVIIHMTRSVAATGLVNEMVAYNNNERALHRLPATEPDSLLISPHSSHSTTDSTAGQCTSRVSSAHTSLALTSLSSL